MKTSIYILSASDRFNYGDLLFPIITMKELMKYGEYDFHNVGVVESDLSSIGALPSMKYNVLYKVKKSGKKPILIVAGGEVLGANWSKLYGFVYPSFNRLFKFLSNIERAISKVFPNYGNPMPFVPTNKRITQNFRIVFHSVGGKKAGPKQLRKRVQETFDQSLYISIREKESFNSIKSLFSLPQLMLTPDSAVVMSDHFRFEPQTSNNYIAFQVGHYKNGGDLGLINSELLKLHTQTKLPIIFVPIGNCPGHDDILSLAWLKQNAEYPCEIIAAESIEKIMKTIAQASLFIGTSLHGIITAMAFSVPYVALNPKISKLKSYVSTWAPEPLKTISAFSAIYEKSLNALAVEKRILIENAEMQKELARNSFKTIAELINR